MPEKIQFSREWLAAKAAELGGEPWLYLQGYEWTGVACWRNSEFQFPAPVDWRTSEYWDARLVGSDAEYHCWRLAPGVWNARKAVAAQWQDPIIRKYVLWGRGVVCTDAAWAWVSESNGVSLAVPFPVHPDLQREPLRLTVWEHVQFDPHSGLAYIDDAMFRGFEQVKE